jgi:hypothetical protein
MRLRLETATNAATIITCVAVVAVLADRWFGKPPERLPPTYEVGEAITDLPAVDFRVAERTLLLAASEDCRYCEASIPFYKRVASRLGAGSGATPVQVVLITVDDHVRAQRFVQSSGLTNAQVVRLTPEAMNALKVPGTPTLLLADRSGKVVGAWVGKLNEEREREVLAAIAQKG